jgi:hypothetical protein
MRIADLCDFYCVFLLFRSRVSFPSAQLALVVVDSHLPLCYKSAMKPFEVVEYILEVALYEEETIQFLKRKGVRNVQHLKLCDKATLDRWLDNDLFNEMDVVMLLKVKAWIVLFENANGRLPDWREELTSATFFTSRSEESPVVPKVR